MRGPHAGCRVDADLHSGARRTAFLRWQYLALILPRGAVDLRCRNPVLHHVQGHEPSVMP